MTNSERTTEDFGVCSKVSFCSLLLVLQDTLTKKKIVENDRQKLLQVIEELDEKKKVALRDAWQKVNVDFGSIFSLLLPGSQAKLTPLPGKDILDGLVVSFDPL